MASNYEQEENLSRARKALAEILSSPTYTEAIWTEPIHALPQQFARPNSHHSNGKEKEKRYLNQLVSAQTALDANQLNAQLKEIERAQGRNDETRRQGIVPVDLDLLQHDDRRYHQRDWQRPYILQLLHTINNE